jgi:hypothetical protein
MTVSHTKPADQVTTEILFEAELVEAKWTPRRQMIANFFKAHYTVAMPAVQIAKVCCALYGYETLDLQADLTALVKAKVLRSRRSQGGRSEAGTLYEVNY